MNWESCQYLNICNYIKLRKYDVILFVDLVMILIDYYPKIY